MRKYAMSFIVAGFGALGAAGAALAQPLADAERTIFLPADTQNWGAPMNIAYHPGHDRYYSGGGGYPSNDAFVYDGEGNIVQAAPVVCDLRSWYYNPNTDLLEAATYNAIGGGGDYGLYEIGLTNTGELDGTKNVLLSSVPGLLDSQTMPAYDSVNDVLYSSGHSNAQVNIANRSDGSSAGGVTLDLGSSGGSNTTYSIGYDEDEQWLIVADGDRDQVLVFDIDGQFVGASRVDMDFNQYYGFGYANKQVFLFDSSRGGWQGYDIGAGGGGGRIRLALAGNCPGTTTATVTGATPGNRIYFIHGFAEGTGPNVPGCPGLTVGILNPSITGSDVADANGEASISGNVPAQGCGRVFVQAADNTACLVSNVEGI